jgi:hypothetical protein
MLTRISIALLITVACAFSQRHPISGLAPTAAAYASLPAAATSSGVVAIATDGNSLCNAAGGSQNCWVRSNGTTWLFMGAVVSAGTAVSVPFTAVANTPLTLTHNLNSANWVATVYNASDQPIQLLAGPQQTGANTASITSSANLTGRVVFSAAGLGQSFSVSATANTPATITHNFGTINIVAQCFDGSSNPVIPLAGPQPATTNTASVTFNATATFACHITR